MASKFINTGVQWILGLLGNQFMAQPNMAQVIQNIPMPVQDTITAKAGGGQSGATPLILGFNRVTVAASSGDSVMAPTAAAGQDLLLVNDGANTIRIFASNVINPVTGTLDTIDGVANGTGNTTTAAKRVSFFCLTDGNWLTTASVAST